MSPVHRKSFRIAPFFKRGRRVAGREALQRAECRAGGPAKNVRKEATTGTHRPVPKNQRLRHPEFFVFQLKICRPSTEKVFGSPPFSKGGAGCRAGALQEALGKGESEQFFNSGHFCAETEDFRSLFQIGDGRERRGDTQILIQGVFSIGEGIADLC